MKFMRSRYWIVALTLFSQLVGQASGLAVLAHAQGDNENGRLESQVSVPISEIDQLVARNTKIQVVSKKDPAFDLIPWKNLDDLRQYLPKLEIPNTSSLVLVSMMLQIPGASASSDSDKDSEIIGGVLSLPVAMIFAREVLEAAVIYTNYRSVIQRTPLLEPAQKKTYLRWLNGASAGGILSGSVVATAIGFGTYYAGDGISPEAAEIAEGISKVIASFFVAGISLQIPKWIDPTGYPSNAVQIQTPSISGVQPDSELGAETAPAISKGKLAFNVAWNMFREFGEIGIFLIPSILASQAEVIPLSGGTGIAIAGSAGAGMYLASRCMNKTYLSIFGSTVTGLLATGLFSGGMHEFEEVAGETPELYDLGPSFSHKELPLALIAPFGYSGSPTILQTASWVSFLGGLTALHVVKNCMKVDCPSPTRKIRQWLCGSGNQEMNSQQEYGVPMEVISEDTLSSEQRMKKGSKSRSRASKRRKLHRIKSSAL